MEFLKDFFPPNRPASAGKPLEGEQFRARVRENNTRDLARAKELLITSLQTVPPKHAAQLLFDLQRLSQSALGLAMLDWREGTDPRPYISEIQVGFAEALKLRPEILPGQANPGFMAIVSNMMGWDLPFSTDPPKEEEHKFDMIWMDRWIIAGLFDPSSWSRKDSAPPLKNKFINKCLDDYWALLTDQIEPEEGMMRCIKNYERRATHQTFKALTPIDAGGKYNEIFIDYTLAAILKKRGLTSQSVHDWAWD